MWQEVEVFCNFYKKKEIVCAIFNSTSYKAMNIDIDDAFHFVCLSVTFEVQDENFIKMTNFSIVMITPFSMSSLYSSSPMFPFLMEKGENVSMIVLWNILVQCILC